MASKPERPARFRQEFPDQPGRLDHDGFDQRGRSHLDQIGGVVDLVEALDYSIMKHRKTRRSVKIGPALALPVQWCKANNSNCSIQGGAQGNRRSDRLFRGDRQAVGCSLLWDIQAPPRKKAVSLESCGPGRPWPGASDPQQLPERALGGRHLPEIN
jgi:hypothetical protein